MWGKVGRGGTRGTRGRGGGRNEGRKRKRGATVLGEWWWRRRGEKSVARVVKSGREKEVIRVVVEGKEEEDVIGR